MCGCWLDLIKNYHILSVTQHPTCQCNVGVGMELSWLVVISLSMLPSPSETRCRPSLSSAPKIEKVRSSSLLQSIDKVLTNMVVYRPPYIAPFSELHLQAHKSSPWSHLSNTLLDKFVSSQCQLGDGQCRLC